VPVPPSPPAPSPLDPALSSYLADARLAGWASHRHVGDNGYAAAQWLALRAHFAASGGNE